MQVEYTSNRYLTYRDMMKSIQKLIYASWGQKNIRFTSAYPKKTDIDCTKAPIITYKVVSKTPGVFGKSNAIERRPRQRESIKIKDKNGKDVTLDIMGQMFDYKILFEIWADDGDSADEIAEKFQTFMYQYTGYLKKSGAESVFFESMTDDDGSNKWNTNLIKRDLVYHIRLEEVTNIQPSLIDTIQVGEITYDSSYNMILNVYLLDQDPTREELYTIQSTMTNDDGN
jgi:hypothetical protein